MNKKTIITILLAVVAMAGQAQTKTATITGYSPALKDSTVAESSIDNVRVASDTVIGGHFTLTIPVEELAKSYLSLRGEGCPNHLMTIWLKPGVDVKVTGKDCLYPLWKVESPLPEQQTLSRIMEYGHDTLAEFLRLDLANDPWDEERPVYMKYLKQKMDVLPSLPVDAALLEELEGVAMMARNYPKDFPYMEQLKELEASTAARAPKGFEEQLALIHSQVYPPHVLQVGEEAIDAELRPHPGKGPGVGNQCQRRCHPAQCIDLPFVQIFHQPHRSAEQLPGQQLHPGAVFQHRKEFLEPGIKMQRTLTSEHRIRVKGQHGAKILNIVHHRPVTPHHPFGLSGGAGGEYHIHWVRIQYSPHGLLQGGGIPWG